jgi:FlaA1/EpsC-like NDP-sugar epimerase
MIKARKFFIFLFEKGRRFKQILVPAGEGLLFFFILITSYLIRLGTINNEYLRQMIILSFILIPLKIFIFWLFKLYHISFRFTSLSEIVLLSKASLLGALCFSLLNVILRDWPFMKGFPRSVIFIDFILTFLFGSALRLSFRIIYFPQITSSGKRVLLIGAGSAGEQLVREMRTSLSANYRPVGFIDDDSRKIGSYIHGVKVIGGKEQIPNAVKKLNVDEIIISIPSARSYQIRQIMDFIRRTRVTNVKILPGLSQILNGVITLSNIRDLDVEDILGREPVRLDIQLIVSYLNKKRVLITGAGGSIGSEICRRVASFEPDLLIMVDIGETEIFNLTREMKEKFPSRQMIFIVGDCKDYNKMESIFYHYRPQIVFHSAAYKHVPIMEHNPREAILNNIETTKVIAQLSEDIGAEKFVFISTDKAVKPTNVMGSTKRVAENVLKCFKNDRCKYISVRFGNVLESRGNVVQIFKEQIHKRKAITITHPDMTRYFMSLSEAVQLVLQAGAIGKGGEIFILDMGEPIKIVDLAVNMIRFYGLEPDKDIPIVFTGIRPGEKLHEELFEDSEERYPTVHEKIFVVKNNKPFCSDYLDLVNKLIEMAKNLGSEPEMLLLLKELAAI